MATKYSVLVEAVPVLLLRLIRPQKQCNYLVTKNKEECFVSWSWKKKNTKKKEEGDKEGERF